MTVEISKEKLLNDLENLNKIIEHPGLYLDDYFGSLRNKVDKECATKLIKLQNDQEKKKELDELWQRMISKIDSFENNCLRKDYDLGENKIRIYISFYIIK